MEGRRHVTQDGESCSSRRNHSRTLARMVSIIFLSVVVALPHPRESPSVATKSGRAEYNRHVRFLGSTRSHLRLRGGSGAVEAESDSKSSDSTSSKDGASTLRTSSPLSSSDKTDNAVDPELQFLLEQGKTLKREGNELHDSEHYHDAAMKYEVAKKLLQDYRPKSKEASDIIKGCCLNLASCYIKLSDWDKTIDICTEVLAQEHNNFKALYRRGLAYKEIAALIPSKSFGASPQDQTAVNNISIDAVANAAALAGSPSDADGAEGLQPKARSRGRMLQLAFRDMINAWTKQPWDEVVNGKLAELRQALRDEGLRSDVEEFDAMAASMGISGATADDSEGALIANMAELVRKEPARVREAATRLRALDASILADYLKARHPSTGSC